MAWNEDTNTYTCDLCGEKYIGDNDYFCPDCDEEKVEEMDRQVAYQILQYQIKEEEDELERLREERLQGFLGDEEDETID